MFIPAVTLETSVTLTGRLLDLLHECLMDVLAKWILFRRIFVYYSFISKIFFLM